MIRINIEDLKHDVADEYVVDDFLVIARTPEGLMKVTTNISNDELLQLLRSGINGLTENGLIPSFDN